MAGPNPHQKIGEFSEQGRGAPVMLSRPAGALPFSPITRQAYAPTPRARIGWGQGVILVEEVALEAARPLAPTDSLAAAVERMLADEGGFAPIATGGHFLGVVYDEALLRAVVDNRALPNLRSLVSEQIPTCAPRSALVDAVRQMLACWLRRIPVVGDGGALVGILTLSAAAAASERDPAVRDAFDGACGPSMFARRWR